MRHHTAAKRALVRGWIRWERRQRCHADTRRVQRLLLKDCGLSEAGQWVERRARGGRVPPASRARGLHVVELRGMNCGRRHGGHCTLRTQHAHAHALASAREGRQRRGGCAVRVHQRLNRAVAADDCDRLGGHRHAMRHALHARVENGVQLQDGQATASTGCRAQWL
eukprot:4015672-Prymnesium_polylepis.1